MGSKVGVDEVIDGHLEFFGKILSLLKNPSNTQYHDRNHQHVCIGAIESLDQSRS